MGWFSKKLSRKLILAVCLPVIFGLGATGLFFAHLQIALWTMLAAVSAALWLSRSVDRRVRAISEAADRLGRGEYGTRVGPLGSDELGGLGENLNLLAERFQATIRELSQEKNQLSAILSNMVEAVVAVDPQERILAVNPALSRLFGVDPQIVQGKPFLETLRHGRLNELMSSTLRDGVRRVDEVKVFTPEEHVFEAHAVPLAQGERRAGALLVLHDITRLRKLEQIRKDFVANVSHELRTPLASIKGFAETLISGALRDPKHAQEFVKDIEEQADRMAKLVDDLLELSAVESGKRPPVLELVSLVEIARDVVNSLKPLAARRKVSIEVQENGEPLRVRADKTQLKQVFTNLLDNAIKFNKEGGQVTVSAEADGDFAVVYVRDTGAGIPKQDLPRLFERFYRVDKARSRELGGTGLGLSIVKHIVETHGGAVDVESIEGEGSTFSFTLPLHS